MQAHPQRVPEAESGAKSEAANGPLRAVRTRDSPSVSSDAGPALRVNGVLAPAEAVASAAIKVVPQELIFPVLVPYGE